MGLPVLRRNVPAHGAPLARILRRDEEEKPPGSPGLRLEEVPEGPVEVLEGLLEDL